MELISPAGSQEAVAAAVQSGADTVYPAISGHTLGRDDNSFTDEEFEYAARYCRVRGCRIYADLNFLVGDNEIEEAADLAIRAAMLGADGIIVHDLGLLRVLRRAAPDLMLIAGSKMGLNNVDSVALAVFAGANRVILDTTADYRRISHIAKSSKVELIIPVHGEMCAGKRGNCYFSAMTSGVSANRATCPGLCRSDFSLGGRMDYYPLSLRDNCLVEHIEEIRQSGVAAVMIEGRDKRPEYSAAVTAIYSRAVHDRVEPTEDDFRYMDELLSDYGLTDGYFTGKKDSTMFASSPRASMYGASAAFTEIRRAYSGKESRRVPIRIFAVIRNGESLFGAEDALGNRAAIRGSLPRNATALSLDEPTLKEIFYRTAGTPYLVEDVSCIMEPRLYLSPETLDEIRRDLLARLSDARMQMGNFNTVGIPILPELPPKSEPPVISIEVRSASQLSPRLAEMGFHILYMPIDVFVENYASAAPFIEADTKIVVTLPHTISDEEDGRTRELLRKARDLGVTEVLIRNTGHIRVVVEEGLSPRGDAALNINNSHTLKTFEEAGLLSATLSYELSLEKIGAVSKCIDTELIVYGRLPIMFTEHCIINRNLHRHACRSLNNLSGRDGALYPILRELGCRNIIFSSQKLFLADRRADYEKLGLWGARLLFTTENSRECVSIAEAYLSDSGYEPNGTTRGLYYS